MLTCLRKQLRDCCFSWVIGLVLEDAGRGIRTQGKKQSWALYALEGGSLGV